MKSKNGKTTKTATATATKPSLQNAIHNEHWVRGSVQDYVAFGIAVADGKLVNVHLRKADSGEVVRNATPVTVQQAAATMATIVNHEVEFETGAGIEITDTGFILFMELVAKQGK